MEFSRAEGAESAEVKFATRDPPQSETWIFSCFEKRQFTHSPRSLRLCASRPFPLLLDFRRESARTGRVVITPV